MLLLYVAVGGALGSVCRYLMTGWLNSLLGRTFPYSTLLVNVFGCFLLGIVVGLIGTMLPRGRELYLMLGMGAAGSFTAFSFFAMDAYLLAERALFLHAALYIGGSVALSVLAFFLGMCVYKLVIS